MSCGHIFYPHCGCPPEPSPASSSDPPILVAVARALAAAAGDPDRLREIEHQVEVAACRASLAQFVHAAWHVIEGDTPLTWNWHHQLVCDVLQGLFEDWERTKDDPTYQNRVRNAVFGLPPGSLKSRLIAVFFPVWCWLRRPGWKLICLSVNDKASLRDGRASRQLIQSQWFQEWFSPNWKIRDDQNSISSYGNTRGGERLSQAMGSEVVGLRGDCFARDTVVTTVDGPIAIGELHAMRERGEELPMVTTRDVDGRQQCRHIEATRVIRDRPMVKLGLSDGRSITCTRDHRFMHGQTGEWIAAGDLAGSPIVDEKLRAVTVVDVEYAGYHDAYDIQVAEDHNFYACGALVHNCLIVDDANNPIEAENKNERDKINELWTTNTFNRVNDLKTSLRIGVQQRVNAEDWTGYICKMDGLWSDGSDGSKPNPNGWLVVAIPAEYEAKRRCVTPWGSDPRTVEGSTIDAVRFPEHVLTAERRRLGSKYAGQMQQRPTLPEGGSIKKIWFNFFRLARGVMPEHDESGAGMRRPEGCKTVEDHPGVVVHAQTHRPGAWEFDSIELSIDCANKKTVRGSYYGFIVGGRIGPRKFVLEAVKHRMEFHEALQLTCDLIVKWGVNTVLIEDKAAGPTLITTLQDAINSGVLTDAGGKPISCVVERIPANGQFEERVDASAVQIKQGLVHLLSGAPWLEELVDEVASFPHAAYDDLTDALSQWLSYTVMSTYELPDF